MLKCITFDVCLCLDLYQVSGDTQQAAEGGQLHDGFTQTLLRDSMAAKQLPEHSLIDVSCLRLGTLTSLLL